MTDVPFCRTLKRGMAGDDVIAHKRAVSRWNPAVYKWHEFTGFYGGELERAVKAYQKQHGLNQDGVIGPVTHERLEKTKNKNGDPVFDATAVDLSTQFCASYGQTPEDKIRGAIVAAGFYWYSHRASISYSQWRPFQMGKPPWVPDRWDCSAFTTVCYYAGGAQNPNGRPWDGLGYTGTLMSRGVRVQSWQQLKPGDMIFYGYSTGTGPAFRRGDPTHVALYVGVKDGTPMVLSHGSYPMRYLAYNYRPINHYRHYPIGV